MIDHICRLLGQATSRNKLSILIYHQVLAAPDPMRPNEPDRQRFRWQMQLLRKHFNPLPLHEAIQLLREERLPANSVCVTFDDGYLNNLEIAQPILEEFGIPATVYVATAFSAGINMWNDRLIDLIGDTKLSSLNLSPLEQEEVKLGGWDERRALVKRLIPMIKHQDFRERQQVVDKLYQENRQSEYPVKMMTPAQVQTLASLGIEIGAHTVDHPILKSHTATEQKYQLATSKNTIEAWLDKPVLGFAYPNGQPEHDYTQQTVELVAEQGFEYAVSTRWGISIPQSDQYQLNRFTPWDKNPKRFHMRLVQNQLGMLA